MLHQIGVKLRAQIHQFSGKLCMNLGKTASMFVEEMLYGIQALGSVHLSEVARSLSEDISLKKTIDRLSRNLAKPELADEISGASGRFFVAGGCQRLRPKAADAFDYATDASQS